MNKTFLSVILVLNDPAEIREIPQTLLALNKSMEQSFSDYEFLLVNNTHQRGFELLEEQLPSEIRKHVYLLNLSSPTIPNHAILAGLDRANGDYTVIFEQGFRDQPELINQLYQKAQEGFDIVYLKANYRKSSWILKGFYALFYWVLRRYSQLKFDDRAHDTRIISRRALNSLLRLRENLRYMKAIYSIVGFPTSYLEVAVPLEREHQQSFGEQFRTSLLAISSYTTFLRSLLLWIFLLSFGFLILVVVNALKVRFTQIDLLGNYHETISGWTFLVVLISIFFAITCLNLYIMSIYLSNIYQEMKQRPLYIIESVKRP
ncbi:MAG: glycosyltransferase [Saprospiraceae bacterium]|nr:glycosyltransferase [Saprospiraceae bacterium]